MSRFASEFNRELGEQLYKQGRALQYGGKLEEAVATNNPVMQLQILRDDACTADNRSWQ